MTPSARALDPESLLEKLHCTSQAVTPNTGARDGTRDGITHIAAAVHPEKIQAILSI